MKNTKIFRVFSSLFSCFSHYCEGKVDFSHFWHDCSGKQTEKKREKSRIFRVFLIITRRMKKWMNFTENLPKRHHLTTTRYVASPQWRQTRVICFHPSRPRTTLLPTDWWLIVKQHVDDVDVVLSRWGVEWKFACFLATRSEEKLDNFPSKIARRRETVIYRISVCCLWTRSATDDDGDESTK